mmetsp:Transcript_5524/g.17712  ORF Transcript_5524/g.17712 Transcript_5524/m.17712 type:complete len:152 (+) Transcript_5524:3027-3482(+)
MYFSFLVCGKFLDMTTFILSDKLGNVYFFRMKQSNHINMRADTMLDFKRKFCLIARFYFTSPIRKILVFYIHMKKKATWICLICANGQIFFVKPILIQDKILFLTKFFYNVNRAYSILYRKKFTCNINFSLGNSFCSVNLEMLTVLNTASK